MYIINFIYKNSLMKGWGNMKVIKETVGEHNGQAVESFLLQNDNGMEVTCLTLGCVITKMITEDANGQFENVVLGFDTVEEYRSNPPFFGAVCGRVAGRIKNAEFELEGNRYVLAKNDGNHHLHGGLKPFSHVVWNGKAIKNDQEVGVEFTYVSPDGEEGYPGTLTMNVTYTLNNDNEFIISYQGQADQSTLLNVTNHSYFNLSVNAKRDVLNHELTIKSNQFLGLNDELLPTGTLLDVDNTAFDFRNGRKISDGVNSDHPQNILTGGGYDHPLLLSTNLDQEITLVDHESGRQLVVETDQPSVVLYTANMLGDSVVINGKKSRNHLGVCLETQGPPDSIHHPEFASAVLKKGEIYQTKTKFKFSCIK